MKKYLLSIMLVGGMLISLGNTASGATVTKKLKKAPTGIIMEYSIETESGKTIEKPKTIKYSPTGSSLPKEVREAMAKLGTGETTSVSVFVDTSHTASGLDLMQIVPYITPDIPRKYLESSYTDTIEKQYVGYYEDGDPWGQRKFIPAKKISVGQIISPWSVLSYFTRGINTIIDAKITKIEGNNVTVYVAKNTESPFYGRKLEVGLTADVRGFQKWTITELTETQATVRIDILDASIKSWDNVKVGYTMKTRGVISTITAIDWDNGTYSDKWYFPENPPHNVIYKIKRIQ